MLPKIVEEDEVSVLILFKKVERTKKAVCVMNMKKQQIWLHNSQIEIVQEKDDDIIEILVPMWLVDEHSLC